jgi:hypothetical protein
MRLLHVASREERLSSRHKSLNEAHRAHRRGAARALRWFFNVLLVIADRCDRCAPLGPVLQ